jgi:hypothetical protein
MALLVRSFLFQRCERNPTMPIDRGVCAAPERPAIRACLVFNSETGNIKSLNFNAPFLNHNSITAKSSVPPHNGFIHR